MYFKNPLAFIIPFLCITSFCSCTSTPQKSNDISYYIPSFSDNKTVARVTNNSGGTAIAVAEGSGAKSIIKDNLGKEASATADGKDSLAIIEKTGKGSRATATAKGNDSQAIIQNTGKNTNTSATADSDNHDSPQKNKKRIHENFSKDTKDVLPAFDEYTYTIGIGSCENCTHYGGEEECTYLARMKARVDAIGKLTENLSIESNFESLRDTSKESYGNNNVKNTKDIDYESYHRSATVKSDGKILRGFIFRDVGWTDSNQFEVRAISPDLNKIPTKNIYIFGYGKSKEEAEVDALWQAGTFIGCISFNQYKNIVMGISKYNDTLDIIKRYLETMQEDTEIRFTSSSPRLFLSDKTQVKEYGESSLNVNPASELKKWKINADDLETLGSNRTKTEYKVLFVFPVKKQQ